MIASWLDVATSASTYRERVRTPPVEGGTEGLQGVGFCQVAKAFWLGVCRPVGVINWVYCIS